MSDNTVDLSGAITALSIALKSMERRQVDLATQISAAKQLRREKLDQLIASLLPDISSTTMDRLKREVPSFAEDHKVMTTFEQTRKILWLFKPSGYDESLALLQAQLKLHLDRKAFVSDENQVIQHLESEKSVLGTQQLEALEMLRLLEKSHRTNTQLPPEAVSSINSLALRGRNLGSVQFNRPPVGSSRLDGSQSNTVQTFPESDMDLWLYVMTDIPTSFRTLMLNSFSDHHDSTSSHSQATTFVSGNGDFGSAGDSNDFVPLDPPVLAQDDSVSIATDDRLGTFS
jgi:hypothetical protein